MFNKYFWPNLPLRIYPEDSLFQKLDNDKYWAAEVKKNGWRCLVYIDTEINFWNRHKDLIKENFINLRKSLSNLPKKTILDGEILNFRTKDVKEKFYLFDVIMWDNKLMLNIPYIERIGYLKTIPENEYIEVAKQVYENKKDLFYSSITDNLLEGIVIKKIDSFYILSTTKSVVNPSWLKVKKIEDHIKANYCRSYKPR